MSINIEYIGHSAFYMKKGDRGILVDPFISGNPRACFDIRNNKITNIFVTHAHADHLGDAIQISRGTNATITCVFELANYCMSMGASVNAVNFGTVNYDWCTVKFLPAFHSSSNSDGVYMGMPASILFDFGDLKIYHAGDTCLNSEMKMIGELYSPDIALLPIGSHFTMDIDEAVFAAKWLNAKKIIPMHYNTFPAIKTDVHKFCSMINAIGLECIVMAYGQSLEF